MEEDATIDSVELEEEKDIAQRTKEIQLLEKQLIDSPEEGPLGNLGPERNPINSDDKQSSSGASEGRVFGGKRSSDSSPESAKTDFLAICENDNDNPKRRCKRNAEKDMELSSDTKEIPKSWTCGKETGPIIKDLACRADSGFQSYPGDESINSSTASGMDFQICPDAGRDIPSVAEKSEVVLIDKPSDVPEKDQSIWKTTDPIPADCSGQWSKESSPATEDFRDPQPNSSEAQTADEGGSKSSSPPSLHSPTPSPSRDRSGSVATDSDDDVGDDVEVKFRPPKHTWSAPRSLRKREYGHRPSEWFNRKVCGSLHMVQRLELMYKLENHAGCVNCLNFNSSGTRLASGSDDTNVTLWDWSTGQSILTFDTRHRLNVFQAKFMPLSGDCHIVTCARDGQVRLAELSSRGVCKDTRKLAQHRGAAHKLSVEVDSPHVFLTCGEDAVVFQIDLRDPKPNKLFVTREATAKVPLYSIHSNPRLSEEFATSGRDNFVRVYDKRRIQQDQDHPDNGPLKKLSPHHLLNSPDVKPNVTCVVYNYNGTELLASYNDEDIYSFDTSHSDGTEYIRRFTGHRNNATVKGVNWYGPCSEFVVSGSDCGNVFLWDKDTERIVQWMAADEGGVVNCLEPHPSVPVLATSGLDHDVKIWVPSNEDPPVLKRKCLQQLNEVVRKNRRQRRTDQEGGDGAADMLDQEMFHFIMQHIRRMRERRQRDEDGQEESSEEDNNGNDSDEDEEDGDGGPVGVQCRTS